ncbi:hypothetical protein K491DRAFT_519443 [Lophiostoma macrostomum CBS 122681]|uniref:Uncharacterized protein n=1 Tax=Lophiostoma macrostomum CBS 122681 TaxID=1314788 RepID=A0A6A6T048_9PLEO|nr:hypothetical protein K491DRAFT_519443 [Lophiostoma macrostomum CBS 122681]
MQSPSASRHNFSLPSVIFRTKSSPHLPKHLQNSSALYDDWSPNNSPTVSRKRSRRVCIKPSEEDITALPIPPKLEASTAPPRTPRKLTKPPTPRKQKPLPKTPESGKEAKPLVIGAPTNFQRVGGEELLGRDQAITVDNDTKTDFTTEKTPLVIGAPTGFHRVGGVELLEQLQRDADSKEKKNPEPGKVKKLVIGCPYNFRYIGGVELLDEENGLEKWKGVEKSRKKKCLGWLACGVF